MPSPRPILALLVLLSLLPASRAAATVALQRHPIESVELLVMRCDTIAYVRLISRGNSPGESQTTSSESFIFDVIQVLKGHVSSPLGIIRPPVAWPPTDIQPGDFAIVARRHHTPGHPEAWIILKTDPDSRDIWTLDLKPLTDTASVITAFRSEIANALQEALFVHPVALDPITPSGRGLPSHLIFPIDSRLEAAARRWATSDDPQVRIQAIRALESFQSDQNTRLLQSLLHDPFTSQSKDHNGIPIGVYEVRQAACAVLYAWKAPLPADLMLETPPGFSRFVSAFRWPLGILVASLLLPPLLNVVARYYRRERRLHVEVLAISRMFFDSCTLLSFVLLLGILMQWRVGATDHSFTVALTRARLESSCAVSFTRAQMLVRLQFGHKPPLNEVQWASGMPTPLFYPVGGTLPSFHFSRSVPSPYTFDADYNPPASGRQYDLIVPALLPAALAALLPLIWLLRQPRFHRRRRRAARGHCLTCGYDLRESPDRCPECGTPNAGRKPAQPAPSPMLAH